MKQLLLMRHGDAERGSAEMNDHARPLSEEGKHECAEAGAWLQSSGNLPDAVFCSTAERTRQSLTALGLPAELTEKAEFRDQLYLASPGEILQCVQSLPDTHARVLILGHNPGIRDFCAMFARSGNTEAHENIALGFKTAGIAGLTFEAEQWQQAPGERGGDLGFYRE